MNYYKLILNVLSSKWNKKKSVGRIKKIQEKKLRKLLKYAYQNSSYYRKIFSEAGIDKNNIHKCQLSSFPTTDKKTFLKNFDEIVTVSDITQNEIREFDLQETTKKSRLKNQYHVVHSSGSTGVPSYFLYDQKAWKTMLVGILRAALWKMPTLELLHRLKNKPRLAFIAATDGRYGGTMAVGDGVGGLRVAQMHLDIKQPITKWIEELKNFKPNVIVGYPSAIKILCELVENKDVQITPFLVVSCGEFLGKSMRQYIEKILRTEVINIYGASESLALGVESNHTDGMILFDDLNVIEVINDSVYLTSLYNFAQPIIRYQITDRLKMHVPQKGNKIPFSRAEHFLGRNEDILWFEDEKGHCEFLHPLAIEGFCEEGLLDYQFIKDGKRAFRMLAESDSVMNQVNIKEKVTVEMKNILAEKGLDYVAFSIEFVENIMPDEKTGKKPLIRKV